MDYEKRVNHTCKAYNLMKKLEERSRHLMGNSAQIFKLKQEIVAHCKQYQQKIKELDLVVDGYDQDLFNDELI